MIIHYNCTIDSFLFHSFLLMCTPYLLIISFLVEVKLEHQGAPNMLVLLHYACMHTSTNHVSDELSIVTRAMVSF